MEEHVELALSRWAKEYNKELERREEGRKRAEARIGEFARAVGFQVLSKDKSFEELWQGLEGRKSNGRTPRGKPSQTPKA